jgi:HJR/Mrr/RecB family endonuclease
MLASIELIYSASAELLTFSLLEKHRLSKDKELPVTEWQTSSSGEHFAGLAQLCAWLDDDRVHATETEVCIKHALAAGLSDSLSKSLGLPGTVPYILNLTHEGTIDQEHFTFRASWLKPAGTPVIGASREGCILSIGNEKYRIPEPFFTLIERIEVFNSIPGSDRDGRLLQWALIQELLPDSSSESIVGDGYLLNTKFAHASAFSLDVASGVDGFTFDPVLFSAEKSQPIADVNEDLFDLISERDQLLPAAQQRVFTQQRFGQFEECKGSYALKDGWYVVFDDPIRRALSEVRKLQTADRETRRQFVRNPRAVLRALLEGEIDEALLENLFVETAEYSARIADVGLWETTTVPWMERAGDSWLPEKFGIRLNDEYIQIDPSEVELLKAAIAKGIDAGSDSIEWKGRQIPANQSSLSAVGQLMGLINPAEPIEDSPEPAEPVPDTEVPPGAPVVLIIDQNLEQVGFRRESQPRLSGAKYTTPTSLKTSPKPHQTEGLTWLTTAWSSGLSGVLLADDMGLGKTLQGLAFLAWLKSLMLQRKIKSAPFLIVAPVGLLKNWQAEHDKHLHDSGLGEYLIAYGSSLKQLRTQKGKELDHGAPILDTAPLRKADWVLTTYETLRDYQHSFGAVKFSAILFDEVQKIKTPGVLMTCAAKAMNADFTIAMTGTPVENRLADLWCIVDTIEPGLLGDLSSFSRQYEKDPTVEDLKELTAKIADGKDSYPPVMLRRMKSEELKGLPAKNQHSITCPMPPAQAAAYSDAINEAMAAEGQGAMLKAIQSLRSISLHPFSPELATTQAYIEDSARLQATFKLLDEIKDKDEKVLVILESREMQPVFASLVAQRYKLAQQPMIINGEISGAKRQERVDEFQNSVAGFDVIIVSPRAGGVGLTITAANHVIHLSRWWNPAVEDQCTDRVYRIGQEKEVHVYYPLAVHPNFADASFDVRLHDLLENKRSLSRDVLMPPVDAGADAESLFSSTVHQKKPDIAGFEQSLSLVDIDHMEPLQFERWVLDRLNERGYDVSMTPKSNDHGADGYAVGNGYKLVIQVKHNQRDVPCDHNAIEDLIRARRFYTEATHFIAVTNATGFTKKAKKLAEQNMFVLVDRTKLEGWPGSIKLL